MTVRVLERERASRDMQAKTESNVIATIYYSIIQRGTFPAQLRLAVLGTHIIVQYHYVPQIKYCLFLCVSY